jgi:hypothetical protein
MNDPTTAHTEPPRSPAQLDALVQRLAVAMADSAPVSPALTAAARARLEALGVMAGGLLVGAVEHGVGR